MDALGMIETHGLIPLVAASDAMVKTAKVLIVHRDRVDAGLVSVYCRGDIAACQAAVEAGVQAASKVGLVVSSHVIPRPHPNVTSTYPVGLK